MKFVWPALLGILRAAYFAYSVWCLLFPLAIVGFVAFLSSRSATESPLLHLGAIIISALLCLLMAYAIVIVFLRRDPETHNTTAAHANPWQSSFLSWFGTLKWFRNDGDAPAVKLHWPSGYLVENPRGYRIGGPEMRAILEILQPGDILLRGYEGYLDGEFIRRSSPSVQKEFKPGWFTHVALYAGDLTETDRKGVNPLFADKADYFDTGPQRVIHSMAKGVHTEDVLTFLRCDYLAILRLPATLRATPGSFEQGRKDFKLKENPSQSDRLYAALVSAFRDGNTVERQEVVLAARRSAIEKIGEAYDFDCSDTTKFTRFSCAELLYYCLRGVLTALPIVPRRHALFPLAPHATWLRILERTTITPDDYYELAQAGHLRCVWEDATSKGRHSTLTAQ